MSEQDSGRTDAQDDAVERARAAGLSLWVLARDDSVLLVNDGSSSRAGPGTAGLQIERPRDPATGEQLLAANVDVVAMVFGAANVGMLTGDASVNAGAPIIACTAEILANVALREGGGDDGVGNALVVMDEFHFYGDPDRGWAWQVPLLELPQAQFTASALLIVAALGVFTSSLAFWVQLPEKFRWGACRYVFFLIGATSLVAGRTLTSPSAARRGPRANVDEHRPVHGRRHPPRARCRRSGQRSRPPGWDAGCRRRPGHRCPCR